MWPILLIKIKGYGPLLLELFPFVTDIITKQYNNSEIHVQTLYKWDSEGSQKTYLNLYPKHVERHSVRKLLAIVVMFK